ncbi:MAG: cytochrome [Ramlibacter sp.]|jgi:cytochrome c|nr:cytochrome [Ramlibacter sp.]
MSGSRLAAAAAVLAGLLAGGPVSAAVDAGALQRGEQIYSRCAACHGIEGNRTGPQHCGLFGRRAGTAPGFAMYSKAMRESAIVWDARTLDRFIEDPMNAVPGTAMGYAGVKDPKERADLIAWLQQATRAGRSCKPQP